MGGGGDVASNEPEWNGGIDARNKKRRSGAMSVIVREHWVTMVVPGDCHMPWFQPLMGARGCFFLDFPWMCACTSMSIATGNVLISVSCGGSAADARWVRRERTCLVIEGLSVSCEMGRKTCICVGAWRSRCAIR
jgi:hypothetical protein